MSYVRALRRFVPIALGVITLGGCSGLHRAYDYWNPGDARYQRSVAVAHDPYPLNDLGPPIQGGRPLGFTKPLSEVQRAQLYNPPRSAARPVPMAPPVIVSPQPVMMQNSWPAPAPAMAPQTSLPPVQTVPAYPPPPTTMQAAPAQVPGAYISPNGYRN